MAESHEVADMETSVRAVENLLNYRFEDKKLLEAALTHPSYTESASYERLEFLGDAAINAAVSNYIFIRYPNSEPEELTLLRSVNVSTERLARVAVRHRLYMYVRHNSTGQGERVQEFVMAVQEENGTPIHGGLIQAPKVLADIVESVAGAVYVDCNYDLASMWRIFRHILEPTVTLEMLHEQPQPVTELLKVCQRDGKQVNIKYWKNGPRIITSIYVDGDLVASSSSEYKQSAKLNAAKAALEKISDESGDLMNVDMLCQLNEDYEVEGAKQKLRDLCEKNNWSKPAYKMERECGGARRMFICSVEIEIAGMVLSVMGKEKTKVKASETSAASLMLLGLQDHDVLQKK